MSKFAFRPVGSKATPPPPAANAPVAGQPGGVALDVSATPVANAAAPAAPVSAPVAPVQAAPAQPAPAAPVAAVGPVKPAAGAVTEYKGRPAYADDSENLRTGDITLPRMNIVQKVGDLSNIFTSGDVVLNKESVLFQAPITDPKTKAVTFPSPALQIVVCGFRPDRWAEKTEGGEQGNIVDSVEQVVAGGGTISYEEAEQTGKPLFQQLSEALILIQQPEGVIDPSFSYVADGKKWAPALWAMKGSAYTNAAKVFRTTRKAGWLKDEIDPQTGQITKKSAYFHGLWEFTTQIKGYRSGFFAWIPVVKRAAVAETGAEVRALAEKLLG